LAPGPVSKSKVIPISNDRIQCHPRTDHCYSRAHISVIPALFEVIPAQAGMTEREQNDGVFQGRVKPGPFVISATGLPYIVVFAFMSYHMSNSLNNLKK